MADSLQPGMLIRPQMDEDVAKKLIESLYGLKVKENVKQCMYDMPATTKTCRYGALLYMIKMIQKVFLQPQNWHKLYTLLNSMY